MSEKNLLNSIFLEGFLLTTLGFCVLILPKLTSLSFGVMLSSAFIAYGFFKFIFSIINRNFGFNPMFQILKAIYITVIGILLLNVPKINLLWLIALIGVYFILESISTSAFIFKIRNLLNYSACKLLSAIILFLIGLIIILGLPIINFWIVALLSGIAFLIKGVFKLILYFANKMNYLT